MNNNIQLCIGRPSHIPAGEGLFIFPGFGKQNMLLKYGVSHLKHQLINRFICFMTLNMLK